MRRRDLLKRTVATAAAALSPAVPLPPSGIQRQPIIDVHAIWLLGPSNRAAIDDWFREMLSHDLGKRIMFGTDQMRWPDAIGMAIEVIESVKFLTAEQRRDIFYNNAARFLRLPSSDGPRRPNVRS
jgi:hypothetical protein